MIKPFPEFDREEFEKIRKICEENCRKWGPDPNKWAERQGFIIVDYMDNIK